MNKLNGRDFTRHRVRERDNFTCQECGLCRTPEDSKKTGERQLDVHHIGGMCGKKVVVMTESQKLTV